MFLLIVIFALALTGCAQQEDKSEEEAKELVKSFIEAYNNRSAEELYSMLSDDVKANYSLEDAKNLARHSDDFTFNITEYNVTGTNVMINTTFKTLYPGSHYEWARLSFQIAYNDSKPEIDSIGSFQRIEKIEYGVRSHHPTPVPIGYVYHQYVEYYNDRIATEIYSSFSEESKENHTLDEVRKELKFAREHNIKLSFNYSEFSTELLASGEKTMQMPTLMKFNESKLNCSIQCVFQGEFQTEKLSDSSISWRSGHATKIDNWVFEELKKCYNNSRK